MKLILTIIGEKTKSKIEKKIQDLKWEKLVPDF